MAKTVPSDQAPAEVEPLAVAPQPAMIIASAGDTVAELLKRIPVLESVRQQITLVAALYVAYVNNPIGEISLEDAIEELGPLYDTTLDGVRDAIAAITRADTEGVSKLADEFLERTGRPLNTKTLNFTAAVLDEQKEQQNLDRLARELLVLVQTVVNRLGVQDLYTLETSSKSEVQAPERGSLLVSLVNKVAAGMVRKPADEAPIEVEHVSADWLTSAILDSETNEDYVELLKFIKQIIKQMDRYGAQPNMRDIVIRLYANAQGTSSDSAANERSAVANIEAKLKRASELAHSQLDQSNAVLAVVGVDQQRIAQQIDGYVDNRRMYGAVAKKFFPN